MLSAEGYQGPGGWGRSEWGLVGSSVAYNTVADGYLTGNRRGFGGIAYGEHIQCLCSSGFLGPHVALENVFPRATQWCKIGSHRGTRMQNKDVYEFGGLQPFMSTADGDMWMECVLLASPKR